VSDAAPAIVFACSAPCTAPRFRDAVVPYGKSDGAAAPVDVIELLRTAAPLAMDTDEDNPGVDAECRPRSARLRVHPEKSEGGGDNGALEPLT
jgi:hypothetical protein